MKKKLIKSKLRDICNQLDMIGSNSDFGSDGDDFGYDIRKLQEAVSLIIELLEEMNDEKTRSR